VDAGSFDVLHDPADERVFAVADAIDVDFDGTIGWNGEVIAPGDRAAVQAKLAAAAALSDQPELHIRPNKLAAYEHVAMVLAGAQRLGMTKIGIVGNEQFQ
jgi:biopolymer transport protein ExbD